MQNQTIIGNKPLPQCGVTFAVGRDDDVVADDHGRILAGFDRPGLKKLLLFSIGLATWAKRLLLVFLSLFSRGRQARNVTRTCALIFMRHDK